MDNSISTKRRRRAEDDLISNDFSSAAAAVAIDTSKVLHKDTPIQQQLCVLKQGAPQDNNDSIPLLQQLEQKRTQLEIELKKLNEQIHSIKIDYDETVPSNDIKSSLLIAIENDCIAMISSYLDPISLAQCEMTSTKMKKIADSTWDTIEKNVCRMKCRSEEKTAKERIIRHTLASNFARKVEHNIMSGDNKFRQNIWSHESYLPSYGYIATDCWGSNEYEIFVRFSDGTKNWPVNGVGTDEHLLCQGFEVDDEVYTNAVLWSQMNGEDQPDMNLRLDLQLRQLELFSDVNPNELHSGYDVHRQGQEKVYEPKFSEFVDRIKKLLATVVAVHKETRKVYLLSSSLGFTDDVEWYNNGCRYGFDGDEMNTENGSDEICCIRLIADTDEENKGDDGYKPRFCLSIEYHCPMEEYKLVERRRGYGSRIWQRIKPLGNPIDGQTAGRG